MVALVRQMPREDNSTYGAALCPWYLLASGSRWCCRLGYCSLRTWGDCRWRWPHVERECVALAQERLYLLASKGGCFKGPQENQDFKIWMEVPSGADGSTMVGQQSRDLWSSQCSVVLGQNGCSTASDPVFLVPWSGLGICLCGWLLLDPSSIQCILAYTRIAGGSPGLGDTSQLEEDSALWDQHMVGVCD